MAATVMAAATAAAATAAAAAAGGGGGGGGGGNGGGDGTMYPVYKLASAQICGYHWGPKNSGAYVSAGPHDLCDGADATSGTSTDNYLLLAFTQLQVSGSTADTDTCAPGDDTCDAGLRRVLLTK